MDIVDTRSKALPGVIAAAVLCGALACGPARADSSTDAYAFGDTGLSQDYANLVLQVGSQTVTLSDNGFQGWVSSETFNFTGSTFGNTSYLAGVYAGSPRNNFFVFSLAGVNGAVTSAKLELYAGAISGELNYSLYGATAAISELNDSVSPDLALYDQLGTGTQYDAANINSSGSMQTLILTLNASAVSDIQGIIASKKTEFAISGHADPVPETSTWIMMLAGFAGLGVAAYRRGAKGRRAISA